MNVLITGASGGIGYAVTKYLAQNGIKIYACDLQSANFPENVSFLQLDVTDSKSIDNVIEFLKKDEIMLDAIVNIAGVFAIDSFIEIDDKTLQKLFDVNLFGAINLNKALHPCLNSDGRIIITTSEVAPLDPMPFNGIYNTTKTALDCYAQALRQELNLIGQKVITVRPGAFNTDLSRNSLVLTQKLSQKTVLYKKQSGKFYNLVKRFMGKPSAPEKIAPTYYKALTSKHPRSVYKKHINPLLKLLNILPKKMQCSIVKALLK